MASQVAHAGETMATDTDWDETRMESAMARLQEMHVQLRDAIPQLVNPMLVPHPSPEGLYSNYAQNVATTRSIAKELSDLYHEDETREMFKRGEESRAQNTEVPIWQVAEHEDWLDVRKVDTPFKTSTVDSAITLPAPDHIEYAVAIQPEDSADPTYTVTCNKTSKMHTTMMRNINSIASKQDLDHLLDLLGSYKGVRSQRCCECGRVFDRDAQLPLERREQKNKKPDGHHRVQWQPLHSGCR
ncbi:MAG: hypothetical protein LQ350_004611 [Teloschistes chrysophthalmus]|nr:MAG: hypothetical protein LQ350_004611 [Niorma chrysophthalma]